MKFLSQSWQEPDWKIRIENREIDGNRKLFCKQEIDLSLLLKSNKDYFARLNEKQITIKRHCCKTGKTFLLNKAQSSDKCNVTEKKFFNKKLWKSCKRAK